MYLLGQLLCKLTCTVGMQSVEACTPLSGLTSYHLPLIHYSTGLCPEHIRLGPTSGLLCWLFHLPGTPFP